MMRRNLLLIAMTILGLIVTLGLQGCLFGGGDDAAEGESMEGMDGEMAMDGEMPMEGEMPMDDEPGMGGPPMDEAGAPGDAGQLVSEGMAAKHSGDYMTARQKFEAAVAADESNAEAHWGLAWVYAEMADAGNAEMKQPAIDAFTKFLELGGSQDQVAEATAALQRLQ